MSFLIIDIENSNIRVTKDFFELNDNKKIKENLYKIGITLQSGKYFISLFRVNTPYIKKYYSDCLSFSKSNNIFKSDYRCEIYDAENHRFNIYNYILNLLATTDNLDCLSLINDNGRIRFKQNKKLFKITKYKDNSDIFNIIEIKLTSKSINSLSYYNNICLNRYVKTKIILNCINVYRFVQLNTDAITIKYKAYTKKLFNYSFINTSMCILQEYVYKVNSNCSFNFKPTISLLDRKYKAIITDNNYSKIGFIDYKEYLSSYYINGKYINHRTVDKPLSIGKLLNDYTNLTNEEIAKIVDIEKALNEELPIELVKGEDIVKYYKEENYLYKTGELGTSCMRYDSYSNKIQFYALNSNVELAIQRIQDKIVSRALLWTDVDGNKIMDRVYSINNSKILQYNKYCKDNNIINIYEYRQCLMNSRDLTKLGISNWGKVFDRLFYIKLDYIPDVLLNSGNKHNKKPFEEVSNSTMNMPYMDNFKYMDITNRLLTNEVLKEIYKTCAISGDDIDEDEAITLECGDVVSNRFLGSEVVEIYGSRIRYAYESSTYYCDKVCEHILQDESNYSKYYACYIHEDVSEYLEEVDDYILSTDYRDACEFYKIREYKELEEDIIKYTSDEEAEQELPF